MATSEGVFEKLIMIIMLGHASEENTQRVDGPSNDVSVSRQNINDQQTTWKDHKGNHLQEAIAR
jgi:hypothetical protein